MCRRRRVSRRRRAAQAISDTGASGYSTWNDAFHQTGDHSQGVHGMAHCSRCVRWSALLALLLSGISLGVAHAQTTVETFHAFNGRAESVAFHPYLPWIAVGGYLSDAPNSNPVQVWDVSDPAAARPLGVNLVTNMAVVFAVAFSSDGSTLAAGGTDGLIELWDTTSWQKTAIRANTSVTYWVGFRPATPTELAHTSDDSSVAIWDTASARPDPDLEPRPEPIRRFTGHNLGAFEGAFSPREALFAAGTANAEAAVWRIADPQNPLILNAGAGGPTVLSLAFARHERTLATGSTNGSIQLWDPDPDGGGFNRRWQAHNGPVDSLSYSRDGLLSTPVQ